MGVWLHCSRYIFAASKCDGYLLTSPRSVMAAPIYKRMLNLGLVLGLVLGLGLS